MKDLRFFIRSLLVFTLISSLPACGGGGGGGGGGEDVAALLSVSVSPGVIDTGDRTTVEVFIEQLNEDGAAVKVRFPTGLSYIAGSSVLEIDGDAIDVAPTNNVSDASKNYLVYYFRKSTVGNDQAILRFKLSGTAAVASGEVEVDADLDDPNVSNQSEFVVTAPNFDAQGSDGITVNG